MNAKAPLRRPVAGAAVAVLLGGGLLIWFGPRPVTDLGMAEPAANSELSRVQAHTWEEVTAVGEPVSALLPESARSGRFFDADNDGDLDVVVRDGPPTSPAAVQLFLRLESGYRNVTDRLGSTFALTRTFDEIACVDVNEDGRLDVALLESGKPTTILVNYFHRRPFLTLSLAAKASESISPDAHFLVRVDPADRTIVRRLDAQSVAADRPIHIGLGSTPALTLTVNVKWPDGKESQFAEVVPNSGYRLIQGTGTATALPPSNTPRQP